MPVPVYPIAAAATAAQLDASPEMRAWKPSRCASTARPRASYRRQNPNPHRPVTSERRQVLGPAPAGLPGHHNRALAPGPAPISATTATVFASETRGTSSGFRRGDGRR